MKLMRSIIFICTSLFVFVAVNGQQARSVLNFNSNWAFYRGDVKDGEAADCNDRNWAAISIPHTMRLEKKHNGGNKIYEGIGWYRRYFILDKSSKGKRITIYFEGVQKNCDVFLNGEKLQSHYGGYMGFVVDITGKVKYDDNNILAVRVSSLDDPLTPPGKSQARLDFYYYGGIYRNVKLFITNELYISDPLEANKIAGGGLFISYPKVNNKEAEVKIKTHIVNQTKTTSAVTLITSILDKKGLEVAVTTSKELLAANNDKELEQSLVVLKPQLWHPDHPYLYNVISKVYNGNTLADIITTPIGIRSISFTSPVTGAADGFYINGEKLYLRGANRHQSYQNIGDAASNSMQYRDALQIKKGGFNAVRASHYPQSPAFLDACDKIGLLVIECEPGWQFFNKDSVFIKRTYQDVREMIRRDRNRPSVFLWETSLNESPSADLWAKEVVSIAHEEMPNNQLFTSDDFFAKGRKYYDVSYKVINEDGTDPMVSMPSLTREWGDTWIADPAKENGLRASRMYTEKGLIAQCQLRQNALNGTMLEEEGGYWDHAKLDANKRISGYFLWSFNDYTRGSDSVTAFSGVVDIDRYKKFGYYQLQAMQDARNPVCGPVVFIASYNNRPDLDSTIMVFSNCDKVKLYRNGKFSGEMTRKDNTATAPFVAGKGGSPYYLFKTGNYEAGELKAEGILDGKPVCTHVVKTPGQPHHLEIAMEDGIKPIADGSDMIPLHIKVCDKNGTVISNTAPLQSFTIHLRASGDGSLIGANIPRTGIATQQTEGGIGYGIIRTSKHAGTIMVTATCDGLIPAKAIIKTFPGKEKFVRDGQHANWKDEKETVTDKPVTNTNEETLPALINLSQAIIIMEGSNDDKLLKNLSDGDAKTTWSAARERLPVVLSIDLGKKYILKGSRIIWGKDSDWYTYSIQASADGVKWTDIVTEKKVSGQDYKPLLYPHNTIKYIRISINDVQPEKSKPAIGEIELFGEDALK